MVCCMQTIDIEAVEVVELWRSAGAQRWFGKNRAFDESFRRRFLHLHERAAAGELESWGQAPESALALLVLLDQFPRNAFRGTARMYATDELARSYARQAVERGFDERVDGELRLFFYLPFAHSEHLEDQRHSLNLHQRIGYLGNARRHHDIILRFGRFPHRNPILGRAMKPDEQAFLDAGGFAG